MDLIIALETFAFAVFAFVCRPVTWAVEAWGDRLDRITMEGIEELERPYEDMAKKPGCGMMQTFPDEPTVSDIRPAGMVKVHAMGKDGTWDELHDYPVRLLPKVPGIEIKNRRES